MAPVLKPYIASGIGIGSGIGSGQSSSTTTANASPTAPSFGLQLGPEPALLTEAQNVQIPESRVLIIMTGGPMSLSLPVPWSRMQRIDASCRRPPAANRPVDNAGGTICMRRGVNGYVPVSSVVCPSGAPFPMIAAQAAEH
jgi:hypothetical protein